MNGAMGMTGGNLGSGLLWGVAPDHRAGLWALAVAPLTLWLVFRLARALARHGGGGAHLVRRWDDASAAARGATFLMLVSAAVHLALIPAHWSDERGMALLFAVDALLLLVASGLALAGRRWRLPAAALLTATILAYLVAVGGGREGLDELGVATKLVELAALGFTLMAGTGVRAARRRWLLASAAFVALVFLTGVGVWAIAGRDGGMPGEIMQAAAGPATAAQQTAAAWFAAATREGIARYADVGAALAAGYRPVTPPGAIAVHYTNPRYVRDGEPLDPTRPATLVYATTPHGLVLLGAMYLMPKPGEQGPDIGGPLTRWHVHANLCFAPAAIAGVLSPFGACPAGTLNVVTPAMIHVWTVPVPGGPYALVSPEEVARLTVG